MLICDMFNLSCTLQWELRGVSRMIYDDVIGSEPIEFEGMQW